MRICVYGASSTAIDKIYIEKVEKLGELMAERGHSLVFGGGANGLMGAVARGIRAKNGYIMGVIPKFFEKIDAELEYKRCDVLIRPDTMRERKQIMEDNADGFIMVPGGIGTFEEFFEILTLKQLRQLDKPLVVYNIDGYYDEMLEMMTASIDKCFIRENVNELYKVFTDYDEMFSYIENYKGTTLSVKDLKLG